MKTTGVRFLLGGSQFFLAVMEESAARKLIDDFFHRRLGECVTDSSGAWSIRTLSIHAIHLEDLSAHLAQKQANPFGQATVTSPMIHPQLTNWPPRVSG